MPGKSRSNRKIESDIRKQQQSTKNVIPHTSFQRLVAEIVQDNSANTDGFCVREEAVNALQCEAESFLTQVFTRARNLAQYNNRDTVTREDIKFVLYMQDFGARDHTSTEMPGELPAPCDPSGCD